MTPDKIARYQVQSQLGRGGMATVYAAYDPSFERSIAIKVLPPEFLHDPQFRLRFQREAKAIAALEHPGIVPVYDFGEQDGQPYLVMRLMTGGSLKDRITQGPLSLAEATTIVERTGAALASAHAKGVIHRDLKPANILFDNDGNPFIADFGIVKLTEQTSQLTGSGMVGTPAYMAPELATAGGVTPLIDIYAMGVTLYQMLVGELPFDADTPMGLMAAHVTQPVPDLRLKRPGLPDEAQYIIERAMAKDPKERYQSMGELVEDLCTVAAGGGDASTLAVPRTSEPATPRRMKSAAPAATVKRPATLRAGVSPLWVVGGVAATLGIVGGLLFALGVLPPGQQAAGSTSEASPSAEVSPLPTAVSLVPTIQTFGAVEILTPGGGMFEAVAGSRPLDTGDSIRVGEGGVALLTFAEGVSVELHPGAQIVLDRLEEGENTLTVEITQTAGTAYHFISPDTGGLARDYVVRTPLGTARATGTRFWTSEQEAGWLYAPADGSIVLEVGEDDDDPNDNYTAEAANEDCLLVDSAENVTDCDLAATDLTPLTDGQTVTPIQTATPTAQVYAGPPRATNTPPPDQPTPVEGTTPSAVPTGCGNGVCDPGEHVYNCPADCGQPPPGGSQPTNPPAAYCGDGSCNGGETVCSCAGDCGAPACNGAVTSTASTAIVCGYTPPPLNMPIFGWSCTQVDECGNVCATWLSCGC